MNISFLTSGHNPFDDRIFYHMAKSLQEQGNNVGVISSKQDLIDVVASIGIDCFDGDKLSKRDKIEHFIHRITVFNPDIIICSEPLTILAAKRFSKNKDKKIQIVYDITEWYPSKKNLALSKYPFRWLLFIKLLLFNIWVTRFSDSFIFGEWYKSRPYRFLFPRKPFVFTPYYPDLKYIPYCKPVLLKGQLKLSYSGRISLEKGYGNFFKVVWKLAELKPELKIDIKIIGWYETPADKEDCDKFFKNDNPNVSVKLFGKQSFKDFLEIIRDTDIFLDLRSKDFENQRCLPIKLFYYGALGRPVIYTDLISIRKEVDIENFGFLVSPEDPESVALIISEYLNDEELYYKHCRDARLMAENKYNWQQIETHFVKFITSL